MQSKFNYEVSSQIFDADSMLDETNFYHQDQGKPAVLTKQLTYVLGSYNNNYPISVMTSSSLSGKGTRQEIDDVQYTYPVMGRDEKASVVAVNGASVGDKKGKGNAKFIITFTDNWIKRYYVIQSTNGIQLYVHEINPSETSDGYDYLVEVASGDPKDFCPASELQAGTRWIDLYASVAESESRGTESRMAAPGSYKNQLGFIRKSMSWAGTSSERVMNVTIKTDKGESNGWMDLFMWQFEKAWMHEKETHYWYSRYNRGKQGQIGLKDNVTGKVIPMGSGLLEQIPNKSTYSRLSFSSLSNKISEALYGQDDTDNMSITLFTGKGGIREMARLMHEEGIQKVGAFGAGNVADKFITGSGRELMLGGYFHGFYHVDGYTIKVKLNPLFDKGKVAMASPIHPDSGFPLESYRMVFIDDSNYDGQANLRSLYMKGFGGPHEYKHGIVGGLNDAPSSLQILGGSSGEQGKLKHMSTDEDKSSYHRLSSCGVQLLRANKCFDLQCVAGL